MTLKEKFQGTPGGQRTGEQHRTPERAEWAELRTSDLLLHLLHWVHPVLQKKRRVVRQTGRSTGRQVDR